MAAASDPPPSEDPSKAFLKACNDGDLEKTTALVDGGIDIEVAYTSPPLMDA